MQAYDVQMQRLKLALNVESDNAFAQALDISQGAISGAKKRGQIPHSWFFQVSEKSMFSVDWLFAGVGNRHLSKEVSPLVCHAAPAAHHGCAPEVLPKNAELVWLPLVEAALPAGQSAFTPSAHGQHTYAFGQDFIASKGDPQHMVLMRVAGDSMAPEVLDNDIVLIDQSKRGIVPGRLFAVGFEEIVYLKRMDYVPGKLVLSCASPHCPPVELDVQDQNEVRFRIIGRVLWVGRDLA